MTITTLWRTVRGRWHDMVQAVWPASPEERTQAEVARLSSDLSRRFQRLVRLRQRIEQVRDRLVWRQRELTEADSAAPARLGRCADRLARLEQVYAEGRRQLERRKRLCKALAGGQMQVIEVTHGTGEA